MLLRLISFSLASMSDTSLLRMLRYVLEYDPFRTLQIHENLRKNLINHVGTYSCLILTETKPENHSLRQSIYEVVIIP